MHAALSAPSNPHSDLTPATKTDLINGFLPTIESRDAAPEKSPAGMVWIPGGEFSMGMTDPRGMAHGGSEAMSDARPIHRVHVDGLWMDQTDVTNAQFARFVNATGYVTVAERPLLPKSSRVSLPIGWWRDRSSLRRRPARLH